MQPTSVNEQHAAGRWRRDDQLYFYKAVIDIVTPRGTVQAGGAWLAWQNFL